jgi:hypothetical protein
MGGIANKLRFLTALCVSSLIFFIIVFFGTLFGGMGLDKILKTLFGERLFIVLLPAFIVSAYIAFILSRYIYRKILGKS